MKRKILALMLGLTLCLSPVPAAFAAEPMALSDNVRTDEPQQPTDPSQDGFVDVPADAWFAPYVDRVREKGVMIGPGAEYFSPETQLTQAECMTLTFRLYDLMQGNEHVIEKAPGDWGRLTLTLIDGTVFSGYGDQNEWGNRTFDWWSGQNGYEGVFVQVPGEYRADEEEGIPADMTQQAWMDAHPDICGADTPASLILNGVIYLGTTNCRLSVDPYVFLFQPETGNPDEVSSALRHAVYREAGPDRWWRDTCYTIVRRQLEDIFDPAEFTSAPAGRGFFARLIASACGGHLDKLNTVEAIPDLPREKNNTEADEYREAAYALYEAGILTGVDAAGTFAPDATLTRAEAATMVARVLDEGQRVTTPPTSSAQPTEQPREHTYDAALAELRDSPGYCNERLFDTDICTVVVYDTGGFMNASTGRITILYKPGSLKGDGASLTPPTPGNERSLYISRNPDHMELSEDKRTFTYSYRFEEPLENNGWIVRAAGDFVYSVNLAFWEVTESIPQVPEGVNTYAASLERLLAGYAENGYVVENTIESPLCTLIFYSAAIEENGDRSYLLSAVYKTDIIVEVGDSAWMTAEGGVKSFGLPTTKVDDVSRPGAPMVYTDRMPDSISLSDDGSTFTLTYRETYGGTPTTQTIDLRSGISEYD